MEGVPTNGREVGVRSGRYLSAQTILLFCDSLRVTVAFQYFKIALGNSHSTEINFKSVYSVVFLVCPAGHKKGKHANSLSEADLNLLKCGY